MPRALSGVLAAVLVAPIAISSAVATTEAPEDPSATASPSPTQSPETPADELSTPEPDPSSPAPENTEDSTDVPSEDENAEVGDEDGTEGVEVDDEEVTGSAAAVDINAVDPEEIESTLTLLNINDFHGRVDHNVGMNLAATVEAAREENANSIFLSAGDNIGASLFVSSIQQDEPTIDYLNALDLEASALGNHEFDRGADDLTGRVADLAEFDHLAANVVDENGDSLVDPYTTVETEEGQTVAIIGAVTQETPTLVDPSGVQGLTFTDPVDAVNEYAEELAQDDDIDVIVAEYHEHTEAIIDETHPAVDVIFTGHTHDEYVLDAAIPGAAGETRPVLQTGEYGNNLGRVDLELDADGNVVDYSHELVETEAPTAEDIAANPTLLEVQQILDDAAEVAEEEGSEVLATLEDYVTTGYRYGEDPDTGELGHNFDQRDLESTMGHLVADAWLWAGNNNPAGLSADIGMVNSGGLRDEFPGGLRQDINTEIGQITVADAVGVNPFANDIFTTDITGAQLRETLEQQWQTTANGDIPGRPYLQLGLSSNVTYTYTGDIGMAGHETLGDNIDQIWVNGELVQDDDEFTVALPSFLAAGGDNFRALGNGINDQQTALIDTDAFTNYLEEELDGSVAPRFNSSPMGYRILMARR
jgi:5'-nucleotidase